jgi:hypothetical protein
MCGCEGRVKENMRCCFRMFYDLQGTLCFQLSNSTPIFSKKLFSCKKSIIGVAQRLVEISVKLETSLNLFDIILYKKATPYSKNTTQNETIDL